MLSLCCMVGAVQYGAVQRTGARNVSGQEALGYRRVANSLSITSSLNIKKLVLSEIRASASVESKLSAELRLNSRAKGFTERDTINHSVNLTNRG